MTNAPGMTQKSEERTLFELRSLYQRYGYTRYKMRKFEKYDLYLSNKDFLASDQVIAFADTDGTLLALKPDVTLSIVRGGNKGERTVRKVYYQESVYRPAGYTRSFREITQAGVECIGDLSDYDLAEVLLLAVSSLRTISENCVLTLSHMGLVKRILALCGLKDKSLEKALGFVSGKNIHELSALFGADLTAETLDKLNCLVRLPAYPEEALAVLEKAGCGEEVRGLRRVLDALRDTEARPLIQLDLSTVNDLGYYNGIVFKGYIDGIPDKVISGGQYDPLIRKMGFSGSAIGFAVYLDALERMGPSVQTIDALLLYDDQAQPERVMSAVRDLSRDGLSVMAQRTKPEGIRFNRVLRLTESGVKEDG